MTANSAFKKTVRKRMRYTGETYTVAARALAELRDTAAATALDIDPALLAPYPDELVVPADASTDWTPPSLDELGWRVLPADATPQQRAHAESYWRPVSADRPCRCAGPCHHGTVCDDEPSCPGRYVHEDRVAIDPENRLMPEYAWRDFYGCNTCGDQYEHDVALPAVPWGERTGDTLTRYEGIRRLDFLPAEWRCHECGADNQYYCGCRDSQDEDECEECGATGPYGCGCHE